MRQIIFRGKRVDNGEWVEGFYEQTYTYDTNKQLHRILWNDEKTKTAFCADIIPETLGQFTGMTDKNGKRIFEGDIVEFLGSKYEVVFELGAFGLAGVTDWDAIERQIPISIGCDNDLCACLNDNYISLWEISWNLETEYNELNTVKIIGNRFDNPELLTAERSDNENQ